jgi:nitroreductase
MNDSSRRRSGPGASASEVDGADAKRPLTLDRRSFLIAIGSAAAYTALKPHLGYAAHAAPPPGLEPWTLPSDPPAGSIDLARALIRASVLAPSHWNAQPWRFEVEGNSIRILADPTRALPVTDPDRRSMMIGLGAALENMLIAARAWGLHPSVDYFPSGVSHPVVAQVSWTDGEPRRDRGLFAAIPARRTNRRTFDGRGIYPQNRAQLLAQIPGDFALHWIDDRTGMRHIADLAHDASLTQDNDRRAAAEQGAWIRSDDGEARGRGDGVTVNDLEVPGLAHWLPGHAFNPDSWFHRFGVESLARQTRDGLRSAGAIVLLTSTRKGEPVSLMAGQAFQRLSLRATELGIASQAISAPIEVERYRADLLKSFSASGEEPLMLARLGHADAPDPSVRHNVSVVATFRNS